MCVCVRVCPARLLTYACKQQLDKTDVFNFYKIRKRIYNTMVVTGR